MMLVKLVVDYHRNYFDKNELILKSSQLYLHLTKQLYILTPVGHQITKFQKIISQDLYLLNTLAIKIKL